MMSAALVLDRYRVEGRIAIGGAAAVWAATDTRSDAPVALKIFPPITEPPHDGAWNREMRLALRLEHPNIVRCIDAAYRGRSEPAVLVFPRITGGSLRRALVERNALASDEVLSLVVDVASALGCAHRHGIAHLDVKPENVLSDGARWVLTDFGSGRYIGRGVGPPITEWSQPYAAPESLLVGASYAADQYALGLVGLESLGKMGDRAPLPTHLSATLPNVLRRMAARHPARRFSSIESARASLVRPPDEVFTLGSAELLRRGCAVMQCGGSKYGKPEDARYRDPDLVRFCGLPGGPALLQTRRRIAQLGPTGARTLLALERPFEVLACSLEHQRALLRIDGAWSLVSVASGLELTRWPQPAERPSATVYMFTGAQNVVGITPGRPSLTTVTLRAGALTVGTRNLAGPAEELRSVSGHPAVVIRLDDARTMVLDPRSGASSIVPSPPDAVWLDRKGDRVVPHEVAKGGS